MDLGPVREYRRAQPQGFVLESVLLAVTQQAKQTAQVAIVATAQKLLVGLFNIHSMNEPYDLPEVSA